MTKLWSLLNISHSFSCAFKAIFKNQLNKSNATPYIYRGHTMKFAAFYLFFFDLLSSLPAGRMYETRLLFVSTHQLQKELPTSPFAPLGEARLSHLIARDKTHLG